MHRLILFEGGKLEKEPLLKKESVAERSATLLKN